jgi:hypothetical protein
VDGDKTYAELGIPGPAPRPPWCTGSHPDSSTGPGRWAVISHRAIAVHNRSLARLHDDAMLVAERACRHPDADSRPLRSAPAPGLQAPADTPGRAVSETRGTRGGNQLSRCRPARGHASIAPCPRHQRQVLSEPART